ncbi:MAG: NAD(P)H-quinone oxidoreductase [Sulfobacillus benefaciens]|uniref:NADH-quinone oxidoreductase subunit I n=1 Tax=Sulfobacillus benefaciens TaxID=453960 RepID=A0A2T2X0W6_9FIRM|nr:MAG: NAD(P)H-quinone oxidoreductase [Sulfobacillus benefaciens]
MRVKQIGGGLVKGLKVTGTHLFRQPVTRPYPEQHAYTPPRFRGAHRLIEDDCVVCHACDRVCPVNCMTIKGYRGEDRKFVLEQFDIDYNLCMFCNLCVEACPPKCLLMGPEFEISAATHNDLVWTLEDLSYERGESL